MVARYREHSAVSPDRNVSELTTDQQSAIKTAVRNLTDARGLDGWRVADLCDETGMSSGDLEAKYPNESCVRLHYSLLIAQDRLDGLLEGTKVPGRSGRTRVLKVFDALSELVLGDPELARANVLNAVCGQGELTAELVSFSDVMQMSVARALAGTEPGDAEWEMARLFQSIWFASVVSWAAGVRPIEWIDESLRHALRILGPFS
jgi:hypothetical protein